MCMPMGSSCVGKVIEEGGCNNRPCPTSVWSQWETWSSCNERCTRQRTRKCLGVNPTVPAVCLGTVAEEQVCKDAPCRRADISAVWTSWSEWSTCNPVCKSNRTRLCSIPAGCGIENFESRECKGDFCLPNAQVVGASVVVQQSNVIQPIIAHKVNQDESSLWLEWSEWNRCDCKIGKKIRHRNCTRPEHSKCEGKTEETKECGKESDECKTWAHTHNQVIHNNASVNHTDGISFPISTSVPISRVSVTKAGKIHNFFALIRKKYGC